MHVFDLDLTIWETFDKRGAPIWAKQLIFPLQKIAEDIVMDDVGSTCSLKKGVREYFAQLKLNNLTIGYISAGRHWNFDDEHQPSLHLLELFEISHFFNGIKVLSYKTVKKSEFLRYHNQKIIFYDDDDKVIEDVAQLEHVHIQDAKKIDDWSKIGVIKID